MSTLTFENLQARIGCSEFGQLCFQNYLLQEDIWPYTDLAYTPEELIHVSSINLRFIEFQLPWLKLMAKLTALAQAQERVAVDSVRKSVSVLRRLDNFLVKRGYSQASELNNNLLQEFINQGSESKKQELQRYISYSTKLWAEEEWLNIHFVQNRIKAPEPSIKIIPEEILVQIYNNLDLLPPMLERLFRLQLALGWRVSEMLILPRQCLKREGKHWFIKRWIEKRKVWNFHPIHQLIAEIIREQQHFLDQQFGPDSEFDKLFCWISASPKHGAILKHRNATRFETVSAYAPKLMKANDVCRWLKAFSKVADLKDKHGNSFTLTTHMLRRTKASVMAYCETEDEYIAATLGHASLDMLPHYRKRSLERLEKESQAKVFVDMYGRSTTFKPKKLRYEQLANLMKVSTPLGECHRSKMLGDCQYRYACLRCDHHRVTLEDKPKLEDDLKSLETDLIQAQALGAERRVTEINQLIKLIKNRLRGLEEFRRNNLEK